MLSLAVRHWLKHTLGEYQVEVHQSGANSRGFLIQSANQSCFLKCYPTDKSSVIRIEREITFIAHCQQQGMEQVAKVIASSLEHYCVLFEFIENNSVENETFVDQRHVMQSFYFINKINTVENKNLPLASEPAHSVADFQIIVESRLARLSALQLNDKLPEVFVKSFNNKIVNFLQEISIYYQQIKPKHYDELVKSPLISPSDFGLHNALLVDDTYHFIDFEYAGNDSVWKFICDFFAQPEYPVNIAYIKHVTAFISWQTIKDNRQSFCYVYQLTLLKWCLIILNTTIRQHEESVDAYSTKQLMQGLQRAENYFTTINEKCQQLTINLAD